MEVKIKKTWWKRLLCIIGIHWDGYVDGGGMGDAHGCYHCGRDSYAPCIVVNKH